MHQQPSSRSTPWSSVPRLLARLPGRVLRTTRTYTLLEVRLRLQQDDAAHPRTAAVHEAAARTGIWASLLPDRVALDLGHAANRLPTIVLWYRQGVPSHEIGRRLSRFSCAWDAERAIDVAASLIARALNEPELSHTL